MVLVKMMYAGHGSTLPCFKAGEKAVTDMYKRFNPEVDDDDGALNIYT
jgi:phosphatidylinositol 4-kinase